MTSTLHFRRFAGAFFALFLLGALCCIALSAEPNQQAAKSQKAQKEPAQKGDMIVMRDSEDLGGRTDDVARRLAARGIAVSAITIGSTSGSTIPRAEGGGDLRDDNGDVVYTYAHPETMQKIARMTGGRAYVNPFGAHDLDSLAAPPRPTPPLENSYEPP